MGFSEIISHLVQNTWIEFISMILIPVVSIVLSIIIYKKSKRKKSIIYHIKNDSLIKDFKQKIEGLSIEYSGKNINTLTVTKIAFWNNGTDTINRNDIPNNDIFSITIENDFDILDASIIQIINQSNDIKANLSNDNKIVNIDFEYLDNNEGFVLQLFHNYENSDKIRINGTIKGFGKISKGLKKIDILQAIVKELFSPIFISVITVFLFNSFLPFNIHIIFSIFILILLIALLGYIKYKILYPVPKKLKKYFESFN